MKLIGTYQDMGYAHWAPYLINGDPSGLDDEDQAACDAWMQDHKHDPIDVGEEEEFTREVPGLPGTGALYTFPVYEGDYPSGPQFWDPPYRKEEPQEEEEEEELPGVIYTVTLHGKARMVAYKEVMATSAEEAIRAAHEDNDDVEWEFDYLDEILYPMSRAEVN